MTESQDDSGVDLYGVRIDPAAYADSPAALYVYRQSRDGVAHVGVVCDVAVQAVADGRVKVHEAVEQLRVDALVWHHARSDGPPALVMLLHRAGSAYDHAVEAALASEPILDFDGPEGLRQTVWRLEDGAATTALLDELASAPLYIADGHHRAAAALEEWRVAGKPADAGLLCLVHPMDGLNLSAFHRRVSGPIDADRLLALLADDFELEEVPDPPAPSVGTLGVYVASGWHRAVLRSDRPTGVAGLDATLLATRVLDRMEPATSGRVRTVDAVPDAEPLGQHVARCDVDRGALFLLAPPPPEALVEVADAGEVMPPKTTYFEPKPAAGIFLRPQA
ncbi:MAG: DUF1015 family protein [Nocardioides sp.]